MNIRNIDWRAKLRPLYRFATKLPPVVRSLAGLLLIGAGVLGVVMPILGSWMAPLGLLFIAADIPPLRRRVEAWLEIDDDGAERDDGSHGRRNQRGNARPHADRNVSRGGDASTDLNAAGRRVRPSERSARAASSARAPAQGAERSA